MICYCRSQLLHTADFHNNDVNSREAQKKNKLAEVLHSIQAVMLPPNKLYASKSVVTSQHLSVCVVTQAWKIGDTAIRCSNILNMSTQN